MKILEGKSYDVLVCGAGCAGFCAAVQAARAGMRTALVEKYGMPGGIMTVLGNQDVAQFNAHGKMVIEGGNGRHPDYRGFDSLQAGNPALEGNRGGRLYGRR